MADSESNRITRRFGEGRHAQTFHVARAEVLRVLKSAGATTDSHQNVSFEGTAAELVAAGVATLDMFDLGTRSVQRTTWGAFADYIVERRGKGRFELTIRTFAHEYEDLNDKRTRNTVWWKENGAAVDAAVAEILNRLQRHREVRS